MHMHKATISFVLVHLDGRMLYRVAQYVTSLLMGTFHFICSYWCIPSSAVSFDAGS